MLRAMPSAIVLALHALRRPVLRAHAIVRRARVWSTILPLAGVWLHHTVKVGLVSAPVTML